MKNEVIIEMVNVVKEYLLPAGAPANRVLSGISLNVRAGDSISVRGPSGSGKSTLLNIMGALDRATSGRVLIKGLDLSEVPDDRLSYIRNREIGFIFQLHHLLPQCTVIENVLIPTLPFPEKSRDEYYENALQLLRSVGLGSRTQHKPAELSGGEQLRTAIARALINSPGILLADEPTGSLDGATAAEVTEIILKLNREKHVTLISVTHSETLSAMMDKRYELKNGSLIPLQ